MVRYFLLFILLSFILPAFNISAATLTSNGTGGGNWDDASAWDGFSTPADMADGDTLVILASDAITITTNRSFNGVIQIYGTFTMDKGKLSMNSTSVIQLFTGSVIEALNTGQNEKIDIGASNITSDEINSIEPPTTLTEATLPVEVIYFRALDLSGRIKLEWATSFEENFDYFTIERSSDGRSFADYTRIYSRTDFSSRIKTYSFSDEMPFPGRSYYRLKSTDFDGTTDYHGVVSANVENIEPDILIYANPSVGGQITVSFNWDRNSTFRVLDITGKVIEDGLLQPGLNNLSIPPSVQRSIYFIQVEGLYTLIVKKFIIP